MPVVSRYTYLATPVDTYSEYVFQTFVIQRSLRMRHFVVCGIARTT